MTWIGYTLLFFGSLFIAGCALAIYCLWLNYFDDPRD